MLLNNWDYNRYHLQLDTLVALLLTNWGRGGRTGGDGLVADDKQDTDCRRAGGSQDHWFQWKDLLAEVTTLFGSLSVTDTFVGLFTFDDT